MKLAGGTIYALRIPLAEAFRHSSQDREWSDAVVLRLWNDDGIEGFGEGLPRPYVTGESVESMLACISRELWPAIAGRELPSGELGLAPIDQLVPDAAADGVVAHNASRAAVEVAIADCVYTAAGRSLGKALAPVVPAVTYSGVIPAGSVEQTRKISTQMRLMGLSAVKVKVGVGDDAARVAIARKILGPGVSLRLDANGAWSPAEALTMLTRLHPFGIACVEQPIARGPVEELQRFSAACPVPVMVDESLITIADAEALIAANAAQFFNIRISKCGGLARSYRIATRAL